MSARPKKRPFTESADSSSFLNTSIGSSVFKADLEHERSMRALDSKRAAHVKESLEKMVKFKNDELEACKLMLEDEQNAHREGEQHLEQMRKSRDEAMQQVRELHHRAQLMSGDDGHTAALWQQKNNLLLSQNEAKDQEMNSMKVQMRELRTQLKELSQEKNTQRTTPTGASSVQGQKSPAPPDIMQELRRVRMQQAEFDRKHRQAERAAAEWQTKYKELLSIKESSRSLQLRNQKLESQLKESQKNYQLAHLKNEEWQQFGKALLEHFPNEQNSQTKTDYSAPPEATSILRQVQETKQELQEVQQTNRMLEQRSEKLRDMKRPTEARLKSYEQKEAMWKEERKAMEDEANSKQRQIETLQHQEGIWKREIASLQEMVQTFDKLPLAKAAGSGPSVDAKLKTVELELNSTKEELQVLKADRLKMQQEASKLSKERQVQKTELDRVKEKYGKLREALEVQKGKAQEAEARAIRAEELAGKGSFNPEHTKVLHLSQNPLSASLQEQNAKLKKQMKEMSDSKGRGAGGAAAAIPQSEVNVDKLHQRLKQSFKEQIARFREGVTLITGYKIDMIPGVENITFRVRSLYAEREEDHLMLQWPKLQEGESAKTLDLLSTDWAKALSQTDAYFYMTKFDSLPAFLAQVQLAEFEKQTVM